jgi:predicted nuclease of restriction endonuclease-like (RecB) superfamily
LFGSGEADLAFGKFRTKGRIQTKLSQKVSPPRRWSYWKIVIGGLIGLPILEFILGYVDTLLRTGGDLDQQLAWFGYGYLGVVAVVLILAFRYSFRCNTASGIARSCAVHAATLRTSLAQLTRPGRLSFVRCDRDCRPKGTPMMPDARTVVPKGYDSFLSELKNRIRHAQLRAALSVNRGLVLLYWSIGRDILARQKEQGWGAKVIDRLAADLRKAFPEMAGFSPRNLKYMRTFAEAWTDEGFVQQVAAQIPWFHNCVLLDHLKNR